MMACAHRGITAGLQQWRLEAIGGVEFRVYLDGAEGDDRQLNPLHGHFVGLQVMLEGLKASVEFGDRLRRSSSRRCRAAADTDIWVPD